MNRENAALAKLRMIAVHGVYVHQVGLTKADQLASGRKRIRRTVIDKNIPTNPNSNNVPATQGGIQYTSGAAVDAKIINPAGSATPPTRHSTRLDSGGSWLLSARVFATKDLLKYRLRKHSSEHTETDGDQGQRGHAGWPAAFVVVTPTSVARQRLCRLQDESAYQGNVRKKPYSSPSRAGVSEARCSTTRQDIQIHPEYTA